MTRTNLPLPLSHVADDIVPGPSPEPDDHLTPVVAAVESSGGRGVTTAAALWRVPKPQAGTAPSARRAYAPLPPIAKTKTAVKNNSKAAFVVKPPPGGSRFQAPRPVPPRRVVDHRGHLDRGGSSERKQQSRDTSRAVIALDPLDFGTRAERIAHVRSHFLEHAFASLDRYRRSRRMLQSGSGDTQLSFTGVHSDVYDCSNDAFLVALRWWVARLHTMLHLGSGQAWSAFGGGTGLLGPDLSTWPVVVGCKELHSGLYLVTTRDQPVDESALPDRCPSVFKKLKMSSPSSATGPHAGAASSSHTHSSQCGSESHSTGVTHYIAIGATGDIVATSRASPGHSGTGQSSSRLPTQHSTTCVYENCVVRPDWYTFLLSGGSEITQATTTTETRSCQHPSVHHSATASSGAEYLLTLVRTKHDAVDMPSGINRAWRSRLLTPLAEPTRRIAANEEQEVMVVRRLPELEVAERAVLASCALNR